MSAPAQRATAAVKPATTRRRRYRARQRAGKAVLTIEVDSHALIETLIAAKYIIPQEALNRQKVEGAVAAVLDRWIRHWHEQQ